MIRGSKMQLRALGHDDLPHFVRWSNEPGIHQFMVIGYPLSIAQEENWC